MNKFLTNKQIILGITGGIAAYKSADLARRLRETGALVRVVMTKHAKEFITPLTMQAVSGNPVHEDLFDAAAEAAMGHIELARWADAIVVAPATADFMAKLIKGEADDLLSTLCIAAQAPIALAPAMNQAMWKNTRTQENLQALQKQGIHFFGPVAGSQACGDVGFGRMMEPTDIVEQLNKVFASNTWSGKKIVITAGPTREPLDPVRFISNRSSGKMGYALAAAAFEAGAAVTLISGPVNLSAPKSLNLIKVTQAQDMLQAVMKEMDDCDVFIGVAAVADYRCKNSSSQKLPKQSTLTLELERNPDIIAEVAKRPKRPYVVGFAAETDDVLTKARDKLINKKLDMIIANEVGEGIGMDADENAVTVLWQGGEHTTDKMAKTKLARELLNLIASVVTE